jgi:LCP family protein required for cell wall assembly
MRTTLKRGVGRGAGANGNGKAVFPPGTISSITRYRQPPRPARTGFGIFKRLLLVAVLVLSSLVLGALGGGYLYTHQVVHELQARTPAVIKAAKSLDVPVANRAAIALVIGYDHRQGRESDHPSLSDTLMLIRADPVTKTISLLSFPRDLNVPIYCGASPSDSVGHVVVSGDRINQAYGRCGPKGSLLTIKHLTGLSVNYLITVNFHGFKELVDKVGGIWMDIDRRYYNKNTGAYYNNYANINLQPGYQKLTGQEALDFVRFRHTDSDLTRNARQQEFVRAFKEQVSRNLSITSVPSLVHTITENVEVGEGGHSLNLKQVIGYALFAAGLPGGHLFQERIQNVQCLIECNASTSDIQGAVDRFSKPDVQETTEANAAALGEKIKQTAPPPSSVTVTVLNGNGVQGSAATASYLLAQRGYRMLVPPHNLDANAPAQVFHTKIYYDPKQKRSKAAAVALQNLMQPADVVKLPKRAPKLLARYPGSMLFVVLGETFHGDVAPVPTRVVPKHQPPKVRFDASAAELLRPYAKKVRFDLMVPTVLDRNSRLDTLPGDKPLSYYWMDDTRKNKGIRLVFSTGEVGDYWGVQETDFTAAPALADRSFHRIIQGRAYDLYYNGNHLHMVVLRRNGATYWVVNTLLDSLSNETMIAIAKGLKPLSSIH